MKKRHRRKNPHGPVKITFTFSGPSSRADADDASEWNEIKNERKRFGKEAMQVAKQGGCQNVKGKLVRDLLEISCTCDDDLVFQQTVKEIYDVGRREGILAPDQPEITNR